MKKKLYIGLDVHADTIAVAEDGRDGEVRFYDVIAHRYDDVLRFTKRLSQQGVLHFCYEAGPCGYPHQQIAFEELQRSIRQI